MGVYEKREGRKGGAKAGEWASAGAQRAPGDTPWGTGCLISCDPVGGGGIDDMVTSWTLSRHLEEASHHPPPSSTPSFPLP